MGLIQAAERIVEEETFDPFKDIQEYGWQVEISEAESRFIVMCIGRRAGKTWKAAKTILERAWKKPGFYMVITPIHAQGENTWKYVMSFLHPFWARMVERVQNDRRRIHLQNGSEIAWFSADDPDNLRGYGPDGVVFDEFSEMSPAVWEIVRPSLMDKKGWALFMFTPKGKGNISYKFWKRGMEGRKGNGKYKDWLSFGSENPDRGLPSSVNPFIEENDLEEMKEDMSETMVQQELEALFIDEEGRALYCPPDLWGAAIWEENRDPKKQYAMGVDLGKTMDYTVITVIDYDGNVVHIYRWRGIDWATAGERIKAISADWNATALVDSSGIGDAVFDELASKGLDCMPYDIFTNKAKAQLITRLAQGLQQSKIRLPDPDKHHEAKVLKKEIEEFTYRTTEAGMTVYNAPEGEHDDCVVSLALAWYMIYDASLVKSMKSAGWDSKFDKYF